MQITECCEVHSHKKDLYYVKLVKNEKCEGCKACGFGRKNYLIMPALSEIDCEPGDKVTVELPQGRVKASYIYLYVLPLVFMFIGLMVPYGHGEKIMLIGAIIGLTLSIPVIYAIELWFRRRKKYLPVIKQKIPSFKENDK